MSILCPYGPYGDVNGSYSSQDVATVANANINMKHNNKMPKVKILIILIITINLSFLLQAYK